MDYIRGYDKWLTTPPDDDPICEDGCGETLVRDPWDGEWVCENKFCPTRFQGVEKEMAEALVNYKMLADDWLRLYKRSRTLYEGLLEVTKNLGLE